MQMIEGFVRNCGIVLLFAPADNMIETLQGASRASAVDPQTRVKRLGITEYEPTWRAMQSFTASRDDDTSDEIWLTEHRPVYTLGVAGRAAHLPRGRDDIPLIRCDRGGQITYHGPGQIVAYVLLDLKRRGSSVRSLVRLLEQAAIDMLGKHGVTAAGRVDAPGVYVGESKIAALGLRVRRGCCYHGLALNVNMDLSPFHAIDPCGYPGLTVTQMRDLGIVDDMNTVARQLESHLLRVLR